MATHESVLCLSNRRWRSGGDRPQQLLARAARQRRVAYVEEPLFDVSAPALELSTTDEGVLLAVPHLPVGTTPLQADAARRRMLNRVIAELDDSRPVLWYCTPTAVGYTAHLKSAAIVYDCTEDVGRVNAPSDLADRERWLLERADVVFTDSHSLCRHKRRITHRSNIYPFLSCVDIDRFGCAREPTPEPPDQDDVEGPRIGFPGVIDERIDLRLLGEVADARPDLQLVMVGPILGVDPAALPRLPNLHWLGAKPHEQILACIAGWEVAMLPLVGSDQPLYIPPTKVAEYLAAGKPVVSTTVADVIDPYGRAGLAWIGDGAGEFVDAIDDALTSDRHARVTHADNFLFEHSWQSTWEQMWTHVERALASRTSSRAPGARRSTRPAAPSSVATVQR